MDSGMTGNELNAMREDAKRKVMFIDDEELQERKAVEAMDDQDNKRAFLERKHKVRRRT